MKVGIVFLTNKPHANTIKFADEVAKEFPDSTFVVVDSSLPVVGGGGADIVQVPDEVCKEHGYINSNISDNSTHIKKNPIAMDKFLYTFCEHFTDFDFVWVLEDDVFVPSVQTLRNLTIGYSAYDLVVQSNKLKEDDLLDWHWRSIIDKIEPPYYNSMVCAIGISRKLLDCIKAQVHAKKTLIYSEVMFNTIAMQNNLKVICPFELKTIVWMGEWHEDVIQQLENNLFHPMKDIAKHTEIRAKLERWAKNRRKPRRQIPKFLKQLM